MKQLLEYLSYDPLTGIFRWRVKRGPRAAGNIAGYEAASGYISIRAHGHLYYAHRLAWLAVYGELPSIGIDHINGNPRDNRIANLRLATQSQNMANSKGRNAMSGFKGAYFDKRRNKWFSSINGKHLGHFASPEEAHAAYCAAARQHFGQFARKE